MRARTYRSPNDRVRSVRQHGIVDWLPPVQLSPSGQPISIADQVVSAIVLAFALALLAKAFGLAMLL